MSFICMGGLGLTICFCLLHIMFKFKRVKAISLSTSYLVCESKVSEARIFGIVCFIIQSI